MSGCRHRVKPVLAGPTAAQQRGDSSGAPLCPALASFPCPHLICAQRHLQPRAEWRRRDLGCVHGHGHQAGRHATGGHRVVGRGQREGLGEDVAAVGRQWDGRGREKDEHWVE